VAIKEDRPSDQDDGEQQSREQPPTPPGRCFRRARLNRFGLLQGYRHRGILRQRLAVEMLFRHGLEGNFSKRFAGSEWAVLGGTTAAEAAARGESQVPTKPTQRRNLFMRNRCKA